MKTNTAIVAGWLYRPPHEAETVNGTPYTELRLVEFSANGKRNSIHVRAFAETKKRVDAMKLDRGCQVHIQGFTVGYDWSCRCGRRMRTQTILATGIDLLRRKNKPDDPDFALDEFAEEILE